MTAGEVAAVVAAVAAIGAFAVVIVGLVLVTRSLTLLRVAVDELHSTRVSATLVPTASEAAAAAEGTNGSKPVPLLTTVVLSDPVIKAVAAAAGTARAVRTFRGGPR